VTETRLPVLLQALLDDLAQRLRRARLELGERRVCLRDVLRRQRLEAVRLERQSAREHVIAKHTDRIEIAAAVDIELAGRLFRRHVMRRPEGARRIGTHRIEGTKERYSKIGEHGTAARTLEEDVLGLEIAVNDAVLMRGVQRLRQIAEDAPHVTGR